MKYSFARVRYMGRLGSLPGWAYPGFPVYALHVREFCRIIVDPNTQMIEEGCDKRRCRREPQSRNPKKEKPENVHPVPCEPKDPPSDKRERPIGLVEMVDAEGTPEAEITLDRVKEVCRRNRRDDGYDPKDFQIHMERVSIG